MIRLTQCLFLVVLLLVFWLLTVITEPVITASLKAQCVNSIVCQEAYR